MECEKMDALPFLKQETIKREPSDVPLNFLYPNDTNSGEQGPKHYTADRSRGDVSTLLSSRHGEPPDRSDVVAVAESPEKHHDIPSKTHKGLFEPTPPPPRISEKSYPVGSAAIDDTAEQHVFVEVTPPNLPSDSSLQPACSTLDLFQPTVVHTKTLLVSAPNQKAAGSKEGALINQLETVIGSLAIPVEELSPFEQLSVKTDEVFIPNDMSGQTIHVDNDSRSQRVPDEPHTLEVISSHKGQSGEKDPQQTQSHSPLLDSVSARRMKRKICVRKRTMTTRTSSGSLPKACRIEGTSERGLLKGLGMKIFSCSICDASFTQRSLLKKHVSEAHQGKPSPGHAALNEQPPVSITLACPLCGATYKRKYGLKRHFASRHIDAKNIPCPECNYKATKVHNYLRHTDKHKLRQSKCPLVDCLPVARDQPGDLLQLKCFECHQAFERKDALNLHIFNHKAALSLSKAESATLTSPPQNSSNCTCLSSDVRNPDGSTLCVLHSSSHLTSSSDSCPDQVTFGHLPRELRVIVEQSLDFMSKLASRLELLAGSINPDSDSNPSSSIDVKMSLLTMNHIRLLSTELTSLTTSVGNCLINEGQANSKTDMVAENTEDSIAVNDVAETYSHKIVEANQEDVRVRDKDSNNAEYVYKKDEKVENVVQEVEGTKEIKSEHTSVESPSANVRRSRRSCAGARMKLKGKVKKKECKVEPGQVAYDCLECGRNLKDLASLKRHMLIHRNVRPFRCLMCTMTFRRREHLKRHMVKHSQERPFHCDMCTYAAKTTKALHIHTLTHGEAKRLPCSNCSYKGRTPYELAKHERKHNPCSLCGYVANDVADFQLHRRSHLSYSCTECSYSCHSGWQLRRHTRRHVRSDGDDGGERYCCELCGYSCPEKRQFTYHMARHENKTPYSCPECDYKCSSRTSIDAHKLMHAGLRPFLCSFCGASFRRTSHLNNHMLIHKEEKKHVCRTCGRPFRARHNLKMHEMIHTGEKHHKCHLCHFACRRNKELRLHLAKHTTCDADSALGDSDDKPFNFKSQVEAVGDSSS